MRYDPQLVVGILGGSAGTTYDAFKLLSEANKYGARVALFGRKINNSENQLAFIHFLRLIADSEISAEEAVHAYHGVLQKLGIKPYRSLEEDMQLQTNVMSYGGNGKGINLQSGSGVSSKPQPRKQFSANSEPDFAKMTPAEKVAYQRARWNRILG